ncbi:MAG: Verru_Chthon cassette protein B [Verrucomicrobiota bacterium]
MTLSNKFPLPDRQRSGFTLVEVVIAMGIFVAAFISIMALLPASLDNLNEAGNTSLRSQITRKLSSDLRQIPFSQLESSSVTTRKHFFTAEGLPATEGTVEAVVSAEVLALEMETNVNADRQRSIARATVVIRLHDREINRTTILLPNTGQ